MSKFVPIRITKNDRRDYARLVKNTKAKVRRTKKNYGIDLSANVTTPPIESFSTREEFNRVKQRLSSFTNRANLNYQFRENEYGVVANKATLGKIERQNKLAIQHAKEKLKEVERRSPEISKRIHMTSPSQAVGISVPNKFDFNKVRSQKRLNEIKEQMGKRANPYYYDKKMEQMKLNYIKALEDQWNSYADPIVNELNNMPDEDFYDFYIRNKDRLNFTWIYERDQAQVEKAVNKVLSELDKYWEDGNHLRDLQGF